MVGAFASTHLVLGVEGGEILSLIDPPDWARAPRRRAGTCALIRSSSVHPGSSDVVLLAPFILYDHPQIAPESAGDLCDATEIDEMLMLRTLAR